MYAHFGKSKRIEDIMSKIIYVAEKFTEFQRMIHKYTYFTISLEGFNQVSQF